MVTRLDASSAPPTQRIGCFLPMSTKRRWLASFRPVDTRYRRDAYATLTGARSKVVARLTAPQHLRPGGLGCLHHQHEASWLVSFRPVDTRYRRDAYATLTGTRSRWLPDWTPPQHLRTRGSGFFTYEHEASWLAIFRPVDTRYRRDAYATLTGARSKVVARLDVSSARPAGGLGACTSEHKGFVFPLVGLLDSVTGETQI